MDKKLYTVIVGSGSYIPPVVIPNDHFLDWEFHDPATGEKFDRPNAEIIQKFNEITNIEERRYAEPEHKTSDLAAFAAKDAIESSGYDAESFDFLIVANNFGDMDINNPRTDIMPPISTRVKRMLNIKNPACMCHDVVAGCPGWTTAMIVADSYIKSGNFKRGLVIGSDVNSRVRDPHDRDSMIFSDGAGAVIVEARESDVPVGIISHASRADAIDGGEWLKMAESVNPAYDGNELYIRMMGNKVYVYALSVVPGVVRKSLEDAGLGLEDVSKVLIHQANEKMDDAILGRLFKLYGKRSYPKDLMPMTIRKFGNSSSATVPTLFDLISKGKMEDHTFNSGDNIVLTSVGAGMIINSIIYRIP
ncbi:3-oxoacyl-ACP synthase [Prolixibacter bellariivorans]|uniref:3-oxoacyl-ACP synthase n=1 Tax=Prolixibacter bellariivorans TaxID=314319 RepID=A0A5M4AXJ2_9BACT|nr:ketoacyl-ACP synthase III [Prolixibacter bellariivorans]GET32398.1 3-oxoacyl-ACP synthase [Prolixibacter bellariivorans]